MDQSTKDRLNSTREYLNQTPTWNVEADVEPSRRLVLRIGPCTPAQLMEVLKELLEVEQVLMDTSDTKEIPDSVKRKLATRLNKDSENEDTE